jgi:hypothetical protein
MEMASSIILLGSIAVNDGDDRGVFDLDVFTEQVQGHAGSQGPLFAQGEGEFRQDSHEGFGGDVGLGSEKAAPIPLAVKLQVKGNAVDLRIGKGYNQA